MASTTTKPKKIRLKYDTKTKKVTSKPSSHFKKGDLVEFVSTRGIQVYVTLNPKAYKPSEFTPTSGPVKVIQDPGKKPFMAQCRLVNGGLGYNDNTPPYGVETWP